MWQGRFLLAGRDQVSNRVRIPPANAVAYRRLRDYIFTPFPPIAPRTKRWLDGELSNWHWDWPEFNIDAEEINAEPEPLLLDNYRA